VRTTSPLPGLGSAVGFQGNRDDKYIFYSFSSPNIPPSIYRYDISNKQSTLFREPAIAGFDPQIVASNVMEW